jgi:pilus assembly protein CpaC
MNSVLRVAPVADDSGVPTMAQGQFDQVPPSQIVPPGGKDYSQFVVKIIRPEATLDLIVGLPQILVFKDAPKRIQMEGDGIAAYTVITEKELSIRGKKPGRTVLNLWFADPKDAAKDRVLSYLVQVYVDSHAQVRVR